MDKAPRLALITVQTLLVQQQGEAFDGGLLLLGSELFEPALQCGSHAGELELAQLYERV